MLSWLVMAAAFRFLLSPLPSFLCPSLSILPLVLHRGLILDAISVPSYLWYIMSITFRLKIWIHKAADDPLLMTCSAASYISSNFLTSSILQRSQAHCITTSPKSSWFSCLEILTLGMPSTTLPTRQSAISPSVFHYTWLSWGSFPNHLLWTPSRTCPCGQTVISVPVVGHHLHSWTVCSWTVSFLECLFPISVPVSGRIRHNSLKTKPQLCHLQWCSGKALILCSLVLLFIK